jgi:hypothetical protein
VVVVALAGLVVEVRLVVVVEAEVVVVDEDDVDVALPKEVDVDEDVVARPGVVLDVGPDVVVGAAEATEIDSVASTSTAETRPTRYTNGLDAAPARLRHDPGRGRAELDNAGLALSRPLVHRPTRPGPLPGTRRSLKLPPR